MKTILILAVSTLILSHANADMKCESAAIKVAAKSQHLTENDFKQTFKVKIRHSETDEMVINEAYLFQDKTNKNNEVSVTAQAVKVAGKFNCHAKVSN